MLHVTRSLPDTIPTADELVYRAAGMTCEHCRLAVTDEVSKVAGVSAVDVDLDAKLVRVQGTGIDGAAVVAAIDEAGYDAVSA
jgi:copper chaperone CopZ